MTKFSTSISKKVARLARITGRKCVPFYTKTPTGNMYGPHIVIIGAIPPKGIVGDHKAYIGFVSRGNIPWAALRKLYKAGTHPAVVSSEPTSDEFVEV